MSDKGKTADAVNGADGANTALDAPWWAGLGAVGGVVLVLLGVGGALVLFLGGFDVEGHLAVLHGAAKLVAIGLVVAGTTLFARSRGVGGGGTGDHDEAETDVP
ncbi:hypothetical protein [Streptomyces sp. NPDC127108]|uniref:hypothetical protein n=1 Tax=Streptomyces sp. NPDC127108 TaxID=3345361 RepID=UPI003637B7ED